MRREQRVWAVVIVSSVVLLYVPYLEAPYYGDDFLFVLSDPAKHIIAVLFGRHPVTGWFRPIEASVQAAVQAAVGWQTWPLHVLQMLLHATLGVMVFRFMRTMSLPLLESGIGGQFFAISPVSVSAVLGNDALSQSLVTFFGCTSVWSSWCAAKAESVCTRRWCYVLSVASAVLALCSKESAVPFVAIAATIQFTHQARGFSGWGRRMAVLAPFVAILIVYLSIRGALGLPGLRFGDERYDVHVGVNIPANVTMLLFSAVLPASTVAAHTAIATGSIVSSAVFIASAMLVASSVSYGVWHAGRLWLSGAVGACALVAMFPMAALNHVGELYAYNTLPFVSVLVGRGLGECVRRAARHARVRRMVAMCLVGGAVACVVAVESKAGQMQENGRKAMGLLGQIAPLVSRVPIGGRLILVNPQGSEVDYSVFRLSGFNVFDRGLRIFNLIARRDDLVVEILPVEALGRQTSMPATMVLELRGDNIQVLQDPAR